MRLADIRQYGMDLKNEWSMSDAEPQMDFEDWTHMQCLELARKAKFWEDNHAKLEEKLRIEYDAELEAFKTIAEERIRDEFEQKLNEATHADASEITELRKLQSVLKTRLEKAERDINDLRHDDGKNSSHEHSDGKGGWSV